MDCCRPSFSPSQLIDLECSRGRSCVAQASACVVLRSLEAQTKGTQTALRSTQDKKSVLLNLIELLALEGSGQRTVHHAFGQRGRRLVQHVHERADPLVIAAAKGFAQR